MLTKIHSVVESAYPPLALASTLQAFAVESLYIYRYPRDPNQKEHLHTLFNLTLAASSIALAYFSPILSDLFNGAYYLSRYTSDFYESNLQGRFHLAWKGFYLFGAATALGLVASQTLPLPATLIATSQVAGYVIARAEKTLFAGALWEGTQGTLQRMLPQAPRIPLISLTQTIQL